MKLPSIDYLVNKSKESLLRFPLSILSSLFAVCIGIYLIEFNDDIKNYFPFINLMLVTALGIPLYFCVSVFIAKQNYSFNLKLACQIGASVLLVLIYFSLPNSVTTHNISLPYIRYGVFNIIVHLLVSYVPYVKNRELNGFWNYNKILFIRFWTSLLFSGFLYVGLILALTALKMLFNIKIHDELYFEIFVFIIGFFNTWFFVSGIPERLDKLENVREYPKGLKVFAQYVLLPLLMLYLVILYAYGSKILFYWNWPKGIVSYLISCVSVLGILTLLLIHPYGNLKENSWIKKFTNIYYYIFFPLIIILFIAIGFRIGDYGITINRYVIVLLGIWLSIISIYFSFRKTNIKFIPISLSIILISMSFGPWSIFSVSERSQVNRLQEILRENSILTNNTVKNEVIWMVDSLPQFYSKNQNTNENILNDSVHNELMSILDYLDNHHGFSEIRPLFQQNLDSLIDKSAEGKKYFNEARVYMKTMGLSYGHKYLNSGSKYFSYTSINKGFIKISNYDYLVKFNFYSYNNQNGIKTFVLDSLEHTLLFEPEKDNRLTLKSENDSVNFDFKEMMNSLKYEFGKDKGTKIEKHKMTLNGESETFEIKIEFNSISLDEFKDSTAIKSMAGSVFLKNKK